MSSRHISVQSRAITFTIQHLFQNNSYEPLKEQLSSFVDYTQPQSKTLNIVKIAQLIEQLSNRLQIDEESFIVSIYYLYQFVKQTKICFADRTCQQLIITAIAVASEMHDDCSPRLLSFSKIAKISFERLKTCQFWFLKLSNYNFFMDEKDYMAIMKTYDRMRRDSKKLGDFSNHREESITIAPTPTCLSSATSKTFENQSKTLQQKQNFMNGNKPNLYQISSRTIDVHYEYNYSQLPIKRGRAALFDQ